MGLKSDEEWRPAYSLNTWLLALPWLLWMVINTDLSYVVWQKSNATDFHLTMNFILFTNQGYPLQNSSLGQLHSDRGIVSIVCSSAGRLLLVYLSARRPLPTLAFCLGVVLQNPWFITCDNATEEFWLPLKTVQKIKTHIHPIGLLLSREVLWNHLGAHFSHVQILC